MSLLRVASTSAVRITASTHRQLSSSAFRRAGAVSGGWGEAAPSGAALNSYVVLAEDHQDGGLARRLAVREQHLAEAKTGKQNGRVILGGGLLGADHSEIGSEGAAQHLKGSLLIVRGESIEDVRARLAQDAYVTNNVFDPAKTRIFPFLQASLGAAAETSETADVAASVAAASTAAATSVAEGRAPPSLSELREEEMGRWKEKAMKSLAWLREGGATRGLA